MYADVPQMSEYAGNLLVITIYVRIYYVYTIGCLFDGFHHKEGGACNGHSECTYTFCTGRSIIDGQMDINEMIIRCITAVWIHNKWGNVYYIYPNNEEKRRGTSKYHKLW